MIGFSLLNLRCISRVRRLMAGWKYVCSASTISLTPFSRACFTDTSESSQRVNAPAEDVAWRVAMLGDAYVSQEVHPLQHSLHLPLLLGREHVEQRLQLARLRGKHTQSSSSERIKHRQFWLHHCDSALIGAMDMTSGRSIHGVNVDSYCSRKLFRRAAKCCLFPF